MLISGQSPPPCSQAEIKHNFFSFKKKTIQSKLLSFGTLKTDTFSASDHLFTFSPLRILLFLQSAVTHSQTALQQFQRENKGKGRALMLAVSQPPFSMSCSALAFVTAPLPTLPGSLPGWQLPCSGAHSSHRRSGDRQMGNGPRQAVLSSRSTSGHQSSKNLPWTPPWGREFSRGHGCCVPTALHCTSTAGGFSDHVFNQNASKYDFDFIGKDLFLSLN